MMAFHTATDATYLAFILVSLFALGAGIGAFLTSVLLRPSFWMPMATTKLGFLVLVTTRLVIVIRAGTEVVPGPNWYMAGVLLMALGMVGVTAKLSRRHYSTPTPPNGA